MDVIQKTGLLPMFTWMASDDFLVTWLRCLAITPGGMFLIGLIFEGRIIPINPKKQFLSFMPGDLFLSAFCALLLWMPIKVEIPRTWYGSRRWQLIVLLICMSGAVIVHFIFESRVYQPRSLNSPTKLYHDLVLYGLFNYVMWGAGLPKLLSGNLFGIRLLIFIPLACWLILAVSDSTLGRAIDEKREYAHPSDWRFPWLKS